MRLSYIAFGLAVVASLTGPAPSAAQEAPSYRPRVFFDCNGPNCNSQYYRTEINWVNWVNDRSVADIHVIMGSLGTGAGGREYQLDFLGVDVEAGYEEQLVYRQLSTDTERESLDGITHTLGLGFAQWANLNGFRGLVTLRGPDPELGRAAGQRVVSQEEVDDPWNLWVFRLNANGNRDSESSQTTTRVNGGFNASRVTPTWKLNFNTFVFHNRLRRELTSGRFTDIRTDWNFRQLTAYSVAEHWSIGFTGRVGRQTQFNQRFQAQFSPTLEFSFFPYEEATRRSLTALYSIGPSYQDYFEQTIYLDDHALLVEQSLEINFSSRQQWGDAGFTLRGSHYMHDLGLNNRSIQGNLSYRVTRGFEVNIRGDIAWVSDQIYLPLAELSDEEALLNLQRQATDRESSISVGFSFQFGSIYNNVVNNRFRGIPGFGGGGFGGGGGGGGNNRNF